MIKILFIIATLFLPLYFTGTELIEVSATKCPLDSIEMHLNSLKESQSKGDYEEMKHHIGLIDELVQSVKQEEDH